MISCIGLRSGLEKALVDYRRQMDASRDMFWKLTGREPLSQTARLLRVERFVEKVISCDLPAFSVGVSNSGKRAITITSIGKALLKQLQHLWFFDCYHDYAERPYAFLAACWDAEDQFGIRLPSLAGVSAKPSDYYAELNWIIERIRLFKKFGFYSRGISDRRYESRQRTYRLVGHVSNLLYRYSKLVLVRVDIGYRKEVRHLFNMDSLIADRERLFDLRWTTPCFDNLLGYAWAIEEGIRKGPHCHLLLIFDGSKIRADIRLAEGICQLWDSEVCEGRGCSWNSNAKKHEFDHVGIGMIERADANACSKATYFATYLTKDPYGIDQRRDPQFVRMKPHGARVFGTSQDDFPSVKRGRPQVHPTLWQPADFTQYRWPNKPWESQQDGASP